MLSWLRNQFWSAFFLVMEVGFLRACGSTSGEQNHKRDVPQVRKRSSKFFNFLYEPSLQIIVHYVTFTLAFLWFLSGNYGGALGAAALAKGLEGNKSLRVCLFVALLQSPYHMYHCIASCFLALNVNGPMPMKYIIYICLRVRSFSILVLYTNVFSIYWIMEFLWS